MPLTLSLTMHLFNEIPPYLTATLTERFLSTNILNKITVVQYFAQVAYNTSQHKYIDRICDECDVESSFACLQLHPLDEGPRTLCSRSLKKFEGKQTWIFGFVFATRKNIVLLIPIPFSSSLFLFHSSVLVTKQLLALALSYF